MLKKTIKFKDFNGTEVSEDFYFNLTKAEAALLEVARDGGKTLSESLQTLIENKSNRQVMNEFIEIIRLSYGERSLDGKRFEKSPEITAKFESTGAYHELLLELITDASAAIHFINGCLPEEMSMDPDKVVSESLAAKTPRQLSEERMQGYNKKLAKEDKAPKQEIVPDLPTTYNPPTVASAVIQEPQPVPAVSEPVIQPAPVPVEVTPQFQPVQEPNRDDYNAQLQAQYAAQAQQAQQ